MTRKEKLINSIGNELKTLGLSSIDICSNDEDQLDKFYYIENISKLILKVSNIIDVNKSITEYDTYYQVSSYIKIDENKLYTIILDNYFENNLIECVGDLADLIIKYEDEANSLKLEKTININDSKLKQLIEQHLGLDYNDKNFNDDFSKLSDTCDTGDLIECYQELIYDLGFSFYINELMDYGIYAWKKVNDRHIELDGFDLSYDSYEEFKSVLINLELKCKTNGIN